MTAVYQYLPPLTDDETTALRASIETFGVLHPVTIDEAGTIIDGHHRAAIATDLGVDYPTVTLPGLTHAQKIETALVLNLGRRHLDATERRALVRRLRDEGLSIRWISEKTGIPRSTVQRDAGPGVPGGTPGYVSGRDGKRYRARVDHAAAEWRETWTDALGWQVPATGAELRESISESPFGPLAPNELPAGPAWDQALVAAAALWAAQHLCRTGDRLPAPRHLMDVPKTDDPDAFKAMKWRCFVELELGTYIMWREENVEGKNFDDLDPEIVGHMACWEGIRTVQGARP